MCGFEEDDDLPQLPYCGHPAQGDQGDSWMDFLCFFLFFNRGWVGKKEVMAKIVKISKPSGRTNFSISCQEL